VPEAEPKTKNCESQQGYIFLPLSKYITQSKALTQTQSQTVVQVHVSHGAKDGMTQVDYLYCKLSLWVSDLLHSYQHLFATSSSEYCSVPV